MRLDDDALLARLRNALGPDPVEPTPFEVAGLYRAVTSPPPSRRSRLRWVRRPVPAFAAAAVLLSGGTAVAMDGDSSLPRPIRAVAHKVGLPVDSTDLADARGAVAGLRGALESRNRLDVLSAVVNVEDERGRLTGTERAAVEPQAGLLLARARAFLRGSEAPPSVAKTPERRRTEPKPRPQPVDRTKPGAPATVPPVDLPPAADERRRGPDPTPPEQRGPGVDRGQGKKPVAPPSTVPPRAARRNPPPDPGPPTSLPGRALGRK